MGIITSGGGRIKLPLENLELSKLQLFLMPFTMRAAHFSEMRIHKQQWTSAVVE
jgi:hypothetical protein